MRTSSGAEAAAHGAGDPRADELGDRHRDAARPDQRQAGGGGGARAFGSSQFRSSWTRPTRCEITHKRRLSALGPGVCPANAPASRCATCIRRITAALPDRDPRRARISAINSWRPRPGSPVRFHRQPLRKVRTACDRRRHRPVGDGRGPLFDRPGGYRVGADGRIAADLTNCRKNGDFILCRRRGRPGRRVAEATCFGRRGADPVPGKRRRQPGADGLQHAAPGGAADSRRSATGRHRHGGDGGARLGVTIIARRAGVVDQVDATRMVVRATEETSRRRNPASTSTTC